MKQVDEMPTSGNFIAIWDKDGRTDCSALYWDCETHLMERVYDDFDHECDPLKYKKNGSRFYV